MKEFILESLENKDVASIKRVLLESGDNDILDMFGELDSEEQAIVFRLLPKNKSLLIFENLDVSDQEQLIGSLTNTQANEIIEGLHPDDRVRLLDELPAEVTKKMLAALSAEERKKTNLLMGYEPETAGRIMTPNFVRLKANMTVAEALKKIRRKGFETIYTIFVADDNGKLQGVVSLRSLVLADMKDTIKDLMVTDVTKVSTSTDQEEVARILQKRDLLAIPVVDKDDCIVGIITVDDAMDVLEQEATEDMLSKAGLAKTSESCRSEALIRGSLWSVWKVRLPFLIITVVGGLLAGSVIGAFEGTLEAIIIAAMFIPVVMDMGGNVGVQSSTIFLRGEILGHINKKKIGRHILRESLIGLSMGVIVGVICGLAAFGIQALGVMGAGDMTTWEGARLGFAVMLSLIVVMTVAATIGFTIPFVLMKLNVDPAAGMGPIITSIKDIIGLSTYFGLVTLLLNHLI
ncbi:MAG: magnesium transporter [Firmicutes bacterium]|nr:magnesium transporter [Bacillota bacterium]